MYANTDEVVMCGYIPWDALLTLAVQMLCFILVLFLAVRCLRSPRGSQELTMALARDVPAMQRIGAIAFMAGVCWIMFAFGFAYSKHVYLTPEVPIKNAEVEFVSEFLKCFQIVFVGSFVLFTALILATLCSYRAQTK